jgi:hypothetical protein
MERDEKKIEIEKVKWGNRGLAGKQIPLVGNRSAAGEHRQVADRGFVSACVWQVSVFPDAYSSSLSVVLFVASLQTH